MLSLVSNAPKSMDEAAKKRYQFWETQPVPKISNNELGFLFKRLAKKYMYTISTKRNIQLNFVKTNTSLR